MTNRAVLNLMFTAFAIVFCSVLFPLWARGSDTDDVTGDDVEELRLREDAAVREVNDAALSEIKQTEAIKRNRYSEELGYVPKGNLLSDDELAAIENQRVEKENAVRTRYGYDINSLEQPQAGVSEEQPADVSRKVPAVVKPVALGTVTGIVLYNNKGAVLVAGKIARENDTVLGVKVVKILPDYVEFEKRGKTWKQEVGQPPPESVWEPPAAPAKQSASPAAPKAKPGR